MEMVVICDFTDCVTYKMDIVQDTCLLNKSQMDSAETSRSGNSVEETQVLSKPDNLIKVEIVSSCVDDTSKLSCHFNQSQVDSAAPSTSKNSLEEIQVTSVLDHQVLSKPDDELKNVDLHDTISKSGSWLFNNNQSQVDFAGTSTSINNLEQTLFDYHSKPADQLMDLKQENVVDKNDEHVNGNLQHEDTDVLCLVEEDPFGFIQEGRESNLIHVSAEDGAKDTSQEEIENSTEFLADETFVMYVNQDSIDVKDKHIKVFKLPSENLTKHSCHQCYKVQKCLYKVDNNKNEDTFICSEVCLISFRTLNKLPSKSFDVDTNIPESGAHRIFVRKCAECINQIKSDDGKVLSWEIMDFCKEDCLLKFQDTIASCCSTCKNPVVMGNPGQFLHNIRQFRCELCINKLKKALKICSSCRKSSDISGFVAETSDKRQFNYFCSQFCLEKDFLMMPNITTMCSVCHRENGGKVCFEDQCKNYKQTFCSDLCFVAFKFVLDINPPQCDACKNFFYNKNLTQFSIFYNDSIKNFCCKSCQNILIYRRRRIMSCNWCKMLKFNFSMIKKSLNGQTVMVCSLNCLNLYKAALNTVSLTELDCKFCSKVSETRYYLTMSDGSMCNFCSNICLISFQSQSVKQPISFGTVKQSAPFPVPIQQFRTRNSGEANVSQFTQIGSNVLQIQQNPLRYGAQNTLFSGPVQQLQKPSPHAKSTVSQSIHIESNLMEIQQNPCGSGTQNTLFSGPVDQLQTPRHSKEATVPQSTQIGPEVPQNQDNPSPTVKQYLIVKEPPLPPMKNAAVLCKPIMHSKSVTCKPCSFTKETQTEETGKINFVPLPVPIYIPAPLPLFSAPVPVPMPFPLPIPIPICIPIPRKSADILKELKKTQMMMPDDPFEADLLKIAELLAEGNNSTDVSGDETEFDDDVLQVMDDLDELVADLEDNSNQTQQKPTLTDELRNYLKYEYGVNIFLDWIKKKNELKKSAVKMVQLDLLQLTLHELNYYLCLFVKDLKTLDDCEYAPDAIYYLCLGIQKYMTLNGKNFNIFTDNYFEAFTDCLDEEVRKFSLYNDSIHITTRIEEEHLWESKQLGVHSPIVLINTLMFFNTKYYFLSTTKEHSQLSFFHIMKHWVRNKKNNVHTVLRYYSKQTSSTTKKTVYKHYEQFANPKNLWRCPINLYDFYIAKCPKSIRNSQKPFYLQPENNCVPDSPFWYSTMPLERHTMEKMLNRLMTIKEINVALLKKI